MPYDYGDDVETLVVDCLPHAMNAQNTDWRLRAKAFLEAVERRHWKVVPEVMVGEVTLEAGLRCPGCYRYRHNGYCR